MHLKQLELSGFKSFAKTTVLEFPAKVTAIVGPNGSGKSNIAEAIRWVLGEQSMKSLRGKKGEDLIWNGSASSPRLGKASVTLIFDNQDKGIPLDFEEVSLGRKIFRDGLNEYYLNNSQVRLRDVVEILARIGLGEQKHNIISQGEVDRIIMASPRERREMLEEALGLRIYQLRKNETERKLEATENNMKQVEALLREIAPHLRFLKTQAQKAEARESVEAELKELQKAYFAGEAEEIAKERNKITSASEPYRKKREELGREIEKLLQEVEKGEKEIAGDNSGRSGEEKKRVELEAEGRELERELGRLEGRLEVEREKVSQPRVKVVDAKYIQNEIREVIAEIRAILGEADKPDLVRSQLNVLIGNLDNLIGQIQRGTAEEEKKPQESAVVRELEKTVKNIQEELAAAAKEIEKLEIGQKQSREKSREAQQKIRELDAILRARQDEDKEVALALERFKFDEERLRVREAVWERERKEAGLEEKDGGKDLNISSEDLKKKIERWRARLEEIGSIDALVLKEYQETDARHSFLSRELGDLKQASLSLRELVKELDKHIKEDFKTGFAKIKDEFHHYFRVIFGGGRASLQLVDVPLRGGQGEEGEEGSDDDKPQRTEPGIEISLDLPRKRIKGLAMLSGGERALTSIALLFSITVVSPPPFLVLDETDAALDEANSQRYAAILKELAKKTQLILVTHNRETMKSAGVLYGVTMGDDGVSKLISLKLEEAEVYTGG